MAQRGLAEYRPRGTVVGHRRGRGTIVAVRGRGILVLALAVGLCIGHLAGQPAAAPPAAATKKTPATTTAPRKPVGIRIDRAKRQVVVDAVVSLREGPLEFVLSTPKKDYETLLVTNVPPSSVHAGLLALGLMPGKPARWTRPPGKEPVFVPPQGAQLEISVRWKDAKGAVRNAPVTDWMVAAGTKKKAQATRWVFVGSDFLDDGRYWADVEGYHVSVANFAATVIDVPFKSTDKNALLEFGANPDTVPAKGTKAKLIITAVKGAKTAPVARITFDVNGFGQIRLDGRPIVPEKIAPAVKKFLSRHVRGAAEVRLDPRSLAFDRERLKSILAQAGLRDVTFRTRALKTEVLPRTPTQAARALAWGRGQFARASELIIDPAEDAAAVCKQIERQRKRLERLSELWGDYAAALGGMVAKKKGREGAAGESGGRD